MLDNLQRGVDDSPRRPSFRTKRHVRSSLTATQRFRPIGTSRFQGARSVAGDPQRVTEANQTRPFEADLLAHDPILAEIVRRLVEAYQPERIYLFGSRARGDTGPDSDYDLLVLVDRPTEPLYCLAQKGFRALRGVPAAVDAVVWDRKTFDSRQHLKASFPGPIVREGKLLRAA